MRIVVKFRNLGRRVRFGARESVRFAKQQDAGSNGRWTDRPTSVSWSVGGLPEDTGTTRPTSKSGEGEDKDIDLLVSIGQSAYYFINLLIESINQASRSILPLCL